MQETTNLDESMVIPSADETQTLDENSLEYTINDLIEVLEISGGVDHVSITDDEVFTKAFPNVDKRNEELALNALRSTIAIIKEKLLKSAKRTIPSEENIQVSAPVLGADVFSRVTSQYLVDTINNTAQQDEAGGRGGAYKITAKRESNATFRTPNGQFIYQIIISFAKRSA